MIPLAKLSPKVKKLGRHPRGPSLLVANLRTMRTDKGISLRDAAEASGLDHATLSRIELGFDPDIRNALLVAAFYGLPVEQIWKLKAGRK